MLYVHPLPWYITRMYLPMKLGLTRSVGTGRLFCEVGICVSALCALQMCLPWCGLSWPHKTVAIKVYHVFWKVNNPNLVSQAMFVECFLNSAKSGKAEI